MDETDERYSLNVDYVHVEQLLPRGDSCALPITDFIVNSERARAQKRIKLRRLVFDRVK